MTTTENTTIEKTVPTQQYNNLQAAYDYFNEKLFDGTLANCLLTFGRDVKKCRGYFHSEQWENGDKKCHTISLTPSHLNRPLDAVLSTLVHEMVHLWQQDFGKASRNGYHNKEWGTKMKEIGLYPSSTGEDGGAETGQAVSHYVIPGGAYIEAFKNIPDHVSLPWIGVNGSTKGKKAAASKIKYTCLGCEANAWGKPDLNIQCGDCFQTMEEVG